MLSPTGLTSALDAFVSDIAKPSSPLFAPEVDTTLQRFRPVLPGVLYFLDEVGALRRVGVEEMERVEISLRMVSDHSMSEGYERGIAKGLKL
jgi:hypothetical protein